MSGNGPLSHSELLGTATSVLCKHGFFEVDTVALAGIDRGSHRIFEDPYSIVAVIAFPTWNDLVGGWIECQASLVELMSEYLSKDEYKTWEGYLALLTPGLVPTSEQQEIEKIRYDTARVRKLVSTGSQLREVSDIEDALLPLLPLTEHIEDTSGDTVLGRLPELLKGPNLTSEAVETVVEAFLNQQPLIDSLHKQMNAK